MLKEYFGVMNLKKKNGVNSYRKALIFLQILLTFVLVAFIFINNEQLLKFYEEEERNSFLNSNAHVLHRKVNLSEPEVEGWYRNTSRETTDYIRPNDNTTILMPSNLCPSSSDPLFILIVVSSTAENLKDRQKIRNTWGNTSYFNYPLFKMFHSEANKRNYLDVNREDWKQYAEVICQNKILYF
jgi:hypothetical protein